MPIYRAVAEQISQRIHSGLWPAGTVLPSETALAEEFRVSVGTIRRALGEMTTEGLLARRRKTGTVVTGRSPQHSLRFFYNYFRLHGRNGELQHSNPRILKVDQRCASPLEAETLQIPADTLVVDIHRMRLVGERPAMHQRMILPHDMVPGFPTTAGEVPELIYIHLWTEFNIKIDAVREVVEAELATPEDCRLLNLSPPAAVLSITEVAYDEMARPLLMSFNRASTREDIYINEVR